MAMDMVRKLMESGYVLQGGHPETILSITAVRECAIIVTDFNIYRARPSSYENDEFFVERLFIL